MHWGHSLLCSGDWEVCGVKFKVGLQWGLRVRQRPPRKKSSTTLRVLHAPPSPPSPTHSSHQRNALLGYSAGLVAVERLPEERSVDVNFDLSLHYESTTLSAAVDSPIRLVGDARRQLFDGAATAARSAVTSPMLGGPEDCLVSCRPEARAVAPPRRLSIDGSAAVDSSFDECLHVVDQMNALLAYYYMAEDEPNTVRVVEIFPLTPPGGEPARLGAVTGRARKKSKTKAQEKNRQTF